MLMASQLCSAQRIVEGTNASWDFANHSVETYRELVFTGCSERNPNTGFLSPMFKITFTGGGNFTSFNLDFQEHVYLMDFTIRAPQNGQKPTIVLTGMQVDQGGPTRMYIAEVDFNGNFVNAAFYAIGNYLTPQQVIWSEFQGKEQIVVVGTKADESPDVNPANMVSKKGFVMAIDPTNFVNLLFVNEMESANVQGGSDNDMLETICEMPGYGYFIGGSANNPDADEQNLLTMSIDYSGTAYAALIYDNTDYQYAAASVAYAGISATTGAPLVYVLANNSSSHTFEVATFDGLTGMPTPPLFFRYDITNLVPPGQGIDVNGFKIEIDGSKRAVISGYISAPTGVMSQLLTPFQMLLAPNLATYVQGKYYLSDNNSPLNAYFDESGASVYINTPDISAYNPYSKLSHVVSAHTGVGYDMYYSTPSKVSQCEKGLKTKRIRFEVPAVARPDYYRTEYDRGNYYFPSTQRHIHEEVLCDIVISSMNVSEGSATLSPNPATTELAVSLDTEIRAITVSDMKGNVVLKTGAPERSTMKITLDISTLKPGVYLLDIVNEEGIVQREKFIKQ